MSEKIKIFGQLESGVVGGYVTDITQIEGLEVALQNATNAIKTAKSAVYDSATQKIIFKDQDGTQIFNLDSTPFIKDGMLENVEIIEDKLVFSFNTDSGKQNVKIPITDIFNPDNYYTKTQIDGIAKTSEAVTIAGGPLADDIGTYTGWPDSWKTADGNIQIPADCTLQEIVTVLFLKVKNGSVSWSSPSWSPSLGAPTVELKNGDEDAIGKTYEVGTKITSIVTTNNTVSNNKRTSALTASEGYFESLDGDWKNTSKSVSVDGSTSGSITAAKIWNGETTTSSEHTVTEGVNKFKATQSGITASVGALPSTTVYASTNTKKIISETKAVLNDTAPASKALTSYTEKTVTGVRYMFWGGNPIVPSGNIDSAYVRNNFSARGGSSAAGAATVTIKADGLNYLYVAVPAGKSLVDMYPASGGQLASVLGEVKRYQVNVEGLNGFAASQYTVYEYRPLATLGEDYTVIIN